MTNHQSFFPGFGTKYDRYAVMLQCLWALWKGCVDVPKISVGQVNAASSSTQPTRNESGPQDCAKLFMPIIREPLKKHEGCNLCAAVSHVSVHRLPKKLDRSYGRFLRRLQEQVLLHFIRRIRSRLEISLAFFRRPQKPLEGCYPSLLCLWRWCRYLCADLPGPRGIGDSCNLCISSDKVANESL